LAFPESQRVFHFRLLKLVKTGMRNAASLMPVRGMKMAKLRQRKSPKGVIVMQMMRNRTRVTQNLLNLQRITFMLEQEEVKPLIVIVLQKE